MNCLARGSCLSSAMKAGFINSTTPLGRDSCGVMAHSDPLAPSLSGHTFEIVGVAKYLHAPIKRVSQQRSDPSRARCVVS